MSLTDQLYNIISSLGGFGPELWLSAAFCGILLVELLLRKNGQQRRALAILSLVTVLVAGVWSVVLPWRGFMFLNLLFVDNQALFVQVIVALSALFIILHEYFVYAPADGLNTQPDRLPTEWYSLLIAMTLGLYLMTMSVNLLSIYVSLELVSICSYLLTALTVTRKAAEGGIKYLLFGAISSAIMLYGMSLLYGMTGTLDLTANTFGLELARQDAAVTTVAVLLTLTGLLFKLAGVPFHAWTPDAYQAAPVPVAAFFSTAPKAAAVLVIMRLITVLPVADPNGGVTAAVLQTPLAILALAGILIGNLSALRQTDAKRLLAYSSIAHAGFILVGVVALNEAGFTAVLFYVGTYVFISLAAFFLIDLLAQSVGSDMTISRLAGLGPRHPLLAVALTVVMLALTGLPPTVGFTAKLLSFSALYEAYQRSSNPWLLALFGFGLLNALISLVYYLRIPFLLFFRPLPADQSEPVLLTAGARWLAIGLVIPIIVLFIGPDWLLRFLTREY